MRSFRSWHRLYCGRLLPIFRRSTLPPFTQKFAGSITNDVIGIFRWYISHYGPGIESASNRNEYQQHFRCVRCIRLTSLPLSCADFHGNCEPRPPGNLRACPGLYRDCFTYLCCLYLGIFLFCSAHTCEMWMWRREKHIRRRLETFSRRRQGKLIFLAMWWLVLW